MVYRNREAGKTWRFWGTAELLRSGELREGIMDRTYQPELDRKLDAPNLRQLKQRIVLRCSLQPFTLRDAVDYIESRLEHAGMPEQKVFPEELMAEIHLRFHELRAQRHRLGERQSRAGKIFHCA